MPAEKFWPETAVEGQPATPAVTVSWGADHPGVQINGVSFDRSALNRLVRVVRTARDKGYGRDE